MAFATRTLIDTGSASTGSGKVVILLDLSDHDGSSTALDADGLNGFANGAKLNIRRIRWPFNLWKCNKHYCNISRY